MSEAFSHHQETPETRVDSTINLNKIILKGLQDGSEPMVYCVWEPVIDLRAGLDDMDGVTVYDGPKLGSEQEKIRDGVLADLQASDGLIGEYKLDDYEEDQGYVPTSHPRMFTAETAWQGSTQDGRPAYAVLRKTRMDVPAGQPTSYQFELYATTVTPDWVPDYLQGKPDEANFFKRIEEPDVNKRREA